MSTTKEPPYYVPLDYAGETIYKHLLLARYDTRRNLGKITVGELLILEWEKPDSWNDPDEPMDEDTAGLLATLGFDTLGFDDGSEPKAAAAGGRTVFTKEQEEALNKFMFRMHFAGDVIGSGAIVIEATSPLPRKALSDYLNTLSDDQLQDVIETSVIR